MAKQKSKSSLEKLKNINKVKVETIPTPEQDFIEREENTSISFVDFYHKISAPPINYIFIILLPLVVYMQVVTFGFSYLDDTTMIIDPYNIISDLGNVKEAFVRDAELRHQGIELYRPLQTLTYMLDAQFSGKEAIMYHLTNLILHLLACLSFYAVFRTLKYDLKTSFLVTLIYSIHPVFTHAVAWIPSRGDLLLTLFSILSFITFVKFTNEKKLHYFILHIFLFILAILSKETAVLLPLIYLTYLIFLAKKQKNKYFNLWNILFAVSYIIITLIYMQLRAGAIHGDTDKGLTFDGFIKNIPIFFESISKFFLPVNLSVMPSFQPFTTITGIVFVCLLIIWIILKKGKRMNYVWFGLVWVFILLVPVMIYRPNFSDYAYEYLDHRSYLPMIGMIVVLLEIIPKKFFERQKLFFITSIVIVFIFSIMTFLHSRNYKNATNFFTQAVETNPKSALGYDNLGLEYAKINEYESAIKYFKEAVRLKPDFSDSYLHLGTAYMKSQKRDLALKYLTIAVSQNPMSQDAYMNIGNIYYETAKYPQAIEFFTKALRIKPDYPDAYYNMGAAKFGMNNLDEAVEDIKRAIQLNPEIDKKNKNLEKVMQRIQEVKSGKVVTITPEEIKQRFEQAQLFNRQGVEKGRRGDFRGALLDFNEALKINPRFAEALTNRANARFATGDSTGACRDWQLAEQYGNKVAGEMYIRFCKKK
jgi:protein O-mannosyl-transferase